MTWTDCKLGDVMTLKRGHDLPMQNRQDGDIPIVSSSGVTGFHNESKAGAPGVVTGRYGTLGEVYFMRRAFWPLNTTLYVTDFKGNDPQFVSYFLKNALRDYRNDKAAVPGVDRNVLHRLNVRLPDRTCQERITETLSAYDDLIENNLRRIALLEQAARELYQEWFVRLRFPGHENTRIVGGLPERWERRTIEDVCLSFDDGDWIETKDQGGEDFRLLQISNIGNNEFVETGNYRWITSETFRSLRCNEVLPGDLLISRMPKPIGRAWLVYEQPWRMITAVDVTIARPDQATVDPLYYLHHINSRKHIARCELRATGATRPRISRRAMGALPIFRPPMTLQRTFGQIASDANDQRNFLTDQNKLLAQTRDLLLPRLMSGEVGV